MAYPISIPIRQTASLLCTTLGDCFHVQVNIVRDRQQKQRFTHLE
jgi:hypothetical protein